MSRKAPSALPSGAADAESRGPRTVAARLRRAAGAALPRAPLLSVDARRASAPDPAAPPTTRSPSILTEGETMGAGQGALAGRYQALAAVPHLSQLLPH